MKRSEINRAWQAAAVCFAKHHWHLPPYPRWDITDFGLGDFPAYGLTVVNLAEEPEYCEKLMYAVRNQTTPVHTHARKKEDIICREGRLRVRLWARKPGSPNQPSTLTVPVNRAPTEVTPGDGVVLGSGERVTLVPGVWHEFYPESDECIIGEVSTANDDAHDNFFVDPRIGRFPEIEEDEPAKITLVSEMP